jgi:hypothetical protein
METSKKQTSLFGEVKSTSLQGDSHANHIQRQGKDLASRTSVTCSPKCLEQFERLNHVGSWAKTFVGLLVGMEGWYSKRCNLSWRLKGTKYNRSYFQLLASTPRTKETEYGLLLTPTTREEVVNLETFQKRMEKYPNGTKMPNLATQIHSMLPTPVASDVEGGISDPRQIKNKGTRWVRVSDNTGTEFGAKLRDVAQLLPTPTARDWKGKQSSEYIQNRGEKPNFKIASVPGVVAKLTNTDGKPSQLNPLFVEEMMGFPENWTLSPFLNGEKSQSKPMETP